MAVFVGVLSPAAFAANAEPKIVYAGGNANLDGKIDASDARLILRHFSKLSELKGENLKYADANFDGTVNAADARIVLRIAAKLEYPVMGDFVFTVYGWGHGVGMSQYGAARMANTQKEDGNYYTYKEILSHYYNGIEFANEEMPEKMKVGSELVDTKEILWRIVLQEIGGIDGIKPEALKAQAVAAYTYIMYASGKTNPEDNKEYKVTGVAYAKKEKYDEYLKQKENEDSVKNKPDFAVKQAIEQAIDEVGGEFMTYNGKVINSVFFALSAGKTADSKNIWGGDLPYLKPAFSLTDKNEKNYKTEVVLTSAEMRTYLENYIKTLREKYKDNEKYKTFKLSEYEPEKWLSIISHDKAVSESVGYVSDIHINNSVIDPTKPDDYGYICIRGNFFRENVLKDGSKMLLRSPCFTFEYIPKFAPTK